MTKVSNMLPRSCAVRAPSAVLPRRLPPSTEQATANANADSACPTMISSPKVVEYHSALSDMIQSTAASVIVNA